MVKNCPHNIYERLKFLFIMKYQKNISDSKSLWNYTLSPGWTIEEVEVLKIALMKFGIGKWKSIKRSNCLPGKTIAQMNLQTQRLLGQQSLAGKIKLIQEFMGLNVNLESVFKDNAQKKISFLIIFKVLE